MSFLIDLSRGALGIAVLILICYLLSTDRKAINWRLVSVGLVLQIVLALLILKVPFISGVFDGIAKGFVVLLGFTESGAKFLFGSLVDSQSIGATFAFRILPTIVFFSAITAILYYFGILQVIIKAAAWVMSRSMGLTGPESLAAAANVFIGQTEAPLVVKPYLENMSRSEILCLMTGGMATIAGGVFAAFIEFLGGDSAESQAFFAKHLLTASIISAPAAILAAKMLFPETEKEIGKDELQMSGDVGNNLLDAISKGTTDGLKLAINVGAMLLVFISVVYMANQMLIYGPGEWFNLNEPIIAATDGRFQGLSFTYILGLIFAPFAWLIGTPGDDILIMGQLLGQKTVINEFVAYAEFQNFRNLGIVLQPKTMIIATYALCGFANFASIGIQIGGISALAPGQRKNLTELGIKALIGGTIACLLTATIAGIIA
ncbi:MAG: Na+ dependent nucleoside transporter [Saprospiraceae bacterium]|nr:Na+ dependent nucleoside transporter [Saprospiraceae bacterium]